VPTPSPAPAVPTAPPVAAAPATGAAAGREAARISIDFRDADVRTLLDLVARAGGHEVIFRPEVKGRVAISAVDRPWREVFDEVLARARLQAVEHEGMFLISPATRR
jgi:type IV pilus assembly protein PilQ